MSNQRADYIAYARVIVPLRIAFDARALTSPSRGIRRYTWELYSALADSGAVTLAVGATPSTPLPGQTIPVAAAANPASNFAWCAWGLPAAARRAPFDVFHAPAYTAPLFGVRPVVATLHDISYADAPAWYPYKRDPIRRAFYRRSARIAHSVITDATNTRDAIAAHYGIALERIHVVPLGVGRPFQPRGIAEPALAGTPPYVLAVGDRHARRNIPTLVDAVKRARTAIPELELVLVGRSAGEVDAPASSAGHPPFVRLVQDVSDEALVDLYQRAALVAYPSLYEGFGLPILEGMACGAPVVASRTSVIPETTADAALLVDALDVRAWAEAIEAMVTDRALAEDYRARGLARAATFTWSRTAASTLAVLEHAAR